MTTAHSYQELAILELAKPRAIRSVDLSSDLTYRALNCVTFCLQADRFQRSHVCGTVNEGETPTTTAAKSLGSILDDTCTFLPGASQLRASKAKSYLKCETVFESEL